jgi:hypothetical protein
VFQCKWMCVFNINFSLSWNQKLEIKTPDHYKCGFGTRVVSISSTLGTSQVYWVKFEVFNSSAGNLKYSTLQIKLSNFLNYRISQNSNFHYNNMQSFMQYFPGATWYLSCLYVGSFDTDYIICRNVENFKHLLFLQRIFFLWRNILNFQECFIFGIENFKVN